jgi:RNA polymerase sigma-70 factor, ECF subfamily
MPPAITKFVAIFPSVSRWTGGECAAVSTIASVNGNSLLRYVRLRLKTDEELVADLLSKEPDALTVLFERHSQLVFRIAYRILRNRADAEDAVQQVFLDMFRAVEQFEAEKDSYKSWLLMFAYHRTFNSLRQRRARGLSNSDCLEELPQELIDGANRPLAFAPAETLILIEQALKSIQPRQRRVIELTYYEGLTAEQASQITGESVRVVRHNLYRGLERLRTFLCKPYPGNNHKAEKPVEAK